MTNKNLLMNLLDIKSELDTQEDKMHIAYIDRICGIRKGINNDKYRRKN